MTEPLVLICYSCGSHINSHTRKYPSIRRERDRRGVWRKHDDFIVQCPKADNKSIHPPTTGWNWLSKATRRGAEWLKLQRAYTKHQMETAEAKLE